VRASSCVRELRERGYRHAGRIGRVRAASAEGGRVEIV
jgi:hypothetical protein